MITVAKLRVNLGLRVRVFATVMPQGRVMYRAKPEKKEEERRRRRREARSVGGGWTVMRRARHLRQIRTATRDANSRYGFIFAADSS